MKVFVINDMNHNFDKAIRHGELIFVTEGKVPIFKTDIASNMLKEKLVDFKPDDYLLVSGPPILCMMAVLVIKSIWDKPLPIKTLVFDAKEQDYIVRHLTM